MSGVQLLWTLLTPAVKFVIFMFQIFKGTFHYCKGDSLVKNKQECENSTSGHWENHMYNFDNLARVNMFW